MASNGIISNNDPETNPAQQQTGTSPATGSTPCPITRVAMWSGPRNISTAMMRAWENRTDTFVTDEPFYAHYLHHTGLRHPMREQVIASQPTDWRDVVTQCTTGVSGGKTVHYQKHMVQHMLPHIDLAWTGSTHNMFLIRSPEHVAQSYQKVVTDLQASDLGFQKQHQLFEQMKREAGRTPLVIDAQDVLRDPACALGTICEYCGVEFQEGMLRWRAGRRSTDGVWAPCWYEAVEKSTGFERGGGKVVSLSERAARVVDECRPYYQEMKKYCVTG